MGKCPVSSSRQHYWDPHKPTHYESPKSSVCLIFNMGMEDKVTVQGSRFSKEGNTAILLMVLPVHAAQQWIGL